MIFIREEICRKVVASDSYIKYAIQLGLNIYNDFYKYLCYTLNNIRSRKTNNKC